ncbi:MAG: oligosaccharide repeat unit polymerase [Novosphingobium sp.]|nr:oligosaccharide repeat unit polymerase [Novosphingobium sp.]
MYVVALAFSALTLVLVGGWYARSRYFSMFHPFSVYLLFHGFLFVVRPIFAYLLDYRLMYQVYQFTPSDSDKLTVIIASNLGFLSFAFFCFRNGMVEMRFKNDSVSEMDRVRLARVFIYIAAICLPLGFYSMMKSWGQANEGVLYADMAMDKGTGIFVNTNSNGYLSDAQLLLASCGVVFAWLFRFRLLALMPLLAFVIMKAGTGGRGAFVTSLVSVALLWLYEQRRKYPSFRAAALLVGVALAFNTVGADRGRFVRQMVGSDNTVDYAASGVGDKFLERMDFANLEFFEYLVYAVPQRSHTYGYFLDNLEIFTEPIPRVLWKGKPIGAPFERIFLWNYGQPIGITRSLPGEGWFSLGWLGVVIWCGLWGWGLGWIYRRWVEGPQNTLQTIGYAIFLPTLIVAFRDGALLTLVRQSGEYLAPVVLLYLFARGMGIPSAQEVRAMLARRARALAVSRQPGNAESPTRALPPQLAQLPAAVQRRRLALKRASARPA